MNLLIKNNYNFKMIIFSMITVLLLSLVMPSISSAKEFSDDEKAEQYLQDIIPEIENEIKSETSSEDLDLKILNLKDNGQDKVLIDTLITTEESDNYVTIELDVSSQNIIIDGKVISNSAIETFHADGEIEENYHDITIYDEENSEKKYQLHSNKANASLGPAILAIIRLAVQVGKKVLQKYSQSQVIQALASVTFKTTQLQKKWKHAAEFGVKGNYSKSNASTFQTALQKSINNSTHIFKTTISGQSDDVILHYNSKTKLGVFSNKEGDFITGYKLNNSQIDFHFGKELIIKK